MSYDSEHKARINTLAIIALICAFTLNIVGGILGIVALRQVNRTEEQGRGLALAAIIVGFSFFAVNVLLAIIIFSDIVA